MSKNTAMRASNGRLIDLLDVKPSDIDFNVIGYSLANIRRFTGHPHTQWSVAQHSLLMTDLVTKAAAPYALLHDAHEIFSNDLSSPFKNAMAAIIPDGDKAYRMLCAKFDAAIFKAAGLSYPIPSAIAYEIKEADQVLCSAEEQAIMPGAEPEFDTGALSKRIVFQPEDVVIHAFCNACQRLLPRFNVFEGAAE